MSTPCVNYKLYAEAICKIKNIAAYQIALVSGITHIAEVERIDKNNDSNKYILFFKQNTAVAIHKSGLEKKKVQASPAPRYSSYELISMSKNMDDLWI